MTMDADMRRGNATTATGDPRKGSVSSLSVQSGVGRGSISRPGSMARTSRPGSIALRVGG